jgi:cyclophilin family peptidyl-prolyl cis-trans isomerase
MNTLSKKILIINFITLTLLISFCKKPQGNDASLVLIKTTLGDIKIKLYDSTPLHRENFLKLVNSGIYDNVLFHRVIKDFMIQSGDPATRPEKSKSFPDSLNIFTIPSEFNRSYYHKKGALAAARRGNEENPEMRSSGTQFYIVKGVKYNDTELDAAEHIINSNIKQALFNRLIKHTSDSLRSSGINATDAEVQEIASLKMFDFLSGNNNYKIPEDQRNIYKTIGGVPRLDGTYTVFGEVIEGLDVVDRIASSATDGNDRPLTDIRILNVKIIRK